MPVKSDKSQAGLRWGLPHFKLLFLFLCIWLGHGTLLAKEIRFSAGYQEYNQRLGVVILKSEAVIVGDDFEIKAQNLQYDLNTGEIYARNGVELLKDGDLIEAEEIAYNSRTRRGRLEKFESILQDSFVQGESAILVPQSMTLKNGCVTTCDHSHHHYQIRARRMVLIPGKALYLKGASFYIGGRKILDLPAYKFNLNKNVSDQPFFLIPGYDLNRGLHAKINLDWYYKEKLNGQIKLIPSARQGTDWSAEANYGNSDHYKAQVNASKHQENFRNTQTYRGSLSQKFKSSKISGETNLQYMEDQFVSGAENQELNIGLNLSAPIGKGYYLGASYQEREDLDADKYTLDNGVQTVDKMPELRLDSPTKSIGRLPLRYRYSGRFTRFREQTFRGSLRQEMLEGELGIFSEKLRWGNTGIQFQSQGRLSDYSAGLSRDYWNLNLRIDQKLGSLWSIDSFYNLHTVKGESPFRSFDLLLPQEGVTHRLNYRGAHLSGTLFQSTYDLKRKRYSALSSYLNYRMTNPYVPISFSLRTTYNPGRGGEALSGLSLNRVFAGIRLDGGEQWDWNLQGQYAKDLNSWESFTQTSNFSIGLKSRFQIQNHYNAIQDEWTRLSLGWIQDFHCLEGRLDWDFKQKELAFQFYMKQGQGAGLGFQADYANGLRVSPDLPDILEP